MRRKQQMIALFTILIMFLALITGCGSQTPDVPAETTGEVAEEKTTEAPESTTAEGDVTTEESTTEKTPTKGLATKEPPAKQPTTEEPTTEAPGPMTTELSREQAFREVLVLYPGKGEGQVGYANYGPAAGNWGPQGFSIVGETVCIFDQVNGRILRYTNGVYDEIPLTKNVVLMKCTEENIYLVTKDSSGAQQLCVCDLDGTEKQSVSLPEMIISVQGISVQNGTTVMLKTILQEFSLSDYTDSYFIKCNLETQEFENMGKVPSLTSKINETVRSEHFAFYVFGEANNSLYYECFKYNDENGIYEHFINRQNADGSKRWYIVLDLESYHSSPFQPYFTDADGRLYLMECHEDRTVISEVLLGENN